jgi:hypothetical protein
MVVEVLRHITPAGNEKDRRQILQGDPIANHSVLAPNTIVFESQPVLGCLLPRKEHRIERVQLFGQQLRELFRLPANGGA